MEIFFIHTNHSWIAVDADFADTDASGALVLSIRKNLWRRQVVLRLAAGNWRAAHIGSSYSVPGPITDKITSINPDQLAKSIRALTRSSGDSP